MGSRLCLHANLTSTLGTGAQSRMAGSCRRLAGDVRRCDPGLSVSMAARSFDRRHDQHSQFSVPDRLDDGRSSQRPGLSQERTEKMGRGLSFSLSDVEPSGGLTVKSPSGGATAASEGCASGTISRLRRLQRRTPPSARLRTHGSIRLMISFWQGSRLAGFEACILHMSL